MLTVVSVVSWVSSIWTMMSPVKILATVYALVSPACEVVSSISPSYWPLGQSVELFTVIPASDSTSATPLASPVVSEPL